MKTKHILLSALALFGLLLFTTPYATAQTCDGTGSNFVDLDGDGFNDNAPDADGDGIPNGLDEDWIKNAQDGDGYQHKKMIGKQDPTATMSSAQTKSEKGTLTRSQQFYRIQAFYAYMFQNRLGQAGMAAGSGSGTGVCDGTGGNGDGTGTGICDGTGPHGSQKKGGK